MAKDEPVNPGWRRPAPRALLLLAAALVLAPCSDLRAQDVDPEAEGAAAGAAEEAAEALELTVRNRLTGQPLDETTPAPFRGVLADGLPDKLVVSFLVSRPDSTFDDLGDAISSIAIFGGVLDPATDRSNTVAVGPVHRNLSRVGGGRWMGGADEIDLGFDLKPDVIYDFLAILNVNDVPVDTFTTKFTPGNPVLSIRSTVTSEAGSGRESMRMTGRISGMSALELSSDYLRLSGRGRIDYEDFVLIPPGNCDAGATWKGDYYWEVLEVVLADSPEEFDASLESVGGFPPPVEVVVALDPSIDEVVAIRCGPATVPIPGFKHFFPAFYSAHGDEMSEERRGLVMQGWMPGTGDVIATRTYERAVQIEHATITESTTLELRWPD